MSACTKYILFYFLFPIGITQITAAQQSGDEEIKSVAKTIMRATRFAGLTTIDSLGYPNTRTMDALAPEEDFTIWLATNPKSRKVRQVEANQKVTLYYAQHDKGNYVTIIGNAFLVNDPDTKQAKWQDEWAEFYPSQDDMMLIKVTPISLELVSYENEIISERIDWRAPSIQLKQN